MAFKQINRDGSISTTYLSNGPTVAGMGCGPYGCGMGAVMPRRAMDRASAVALASGALAGPRAAKYALEAFRAQNASSRAGMGALTVTAPGYAFDNVTGQTIKVDDSLPVGSDVSSQYLNASTGSVYSPERSTSTSGGGITSQDVGAGITLASLLAGSGIDAYRRFSGQRFIDPPPPRPAASTGLSTGAMVGIGVLALAVVGGVVYAASGGKSRSSAAVAPTVIRANGKSYVRSKGGLYVCRTNRYAKLMRKAA